LLNIAALIPSIKEMKKLEIPQTAEVHSSLPQAPPKIHAESPLKQPTSISHAPPQHPSKSTISKKPKIDEKLKIGPVQLDMLKEIGNIGTGNAVTALSKLINQRIDIDFTEVNIIAFEDLSSQFANSAEKVCGIFSHIGQPSQSTLLQIFSMKPLMTLIASLAGSETKMKPDKVKSKEDLDDFAISTIKEVGNIMTGHYTSALADLMGIKMVPDVPDFAMADTTLLSDFLRKELKAISKFIVMIKTAMKITDLKISGVFFFIPDLEALNLLFEKLNIKSEITTESSPSKKIETAH